MRQRGFSFMEVLISVMVLTVGILATMSAMTYTLGSIDHGGLVPTATIHAQRLMETIRARNLAFSNLPNAPLANSGVNSPTPVALNDVPFTDVFFNQDVGRFQRVIEMQPIGGNGYQQNLMQVTVTVRWEENRGMDEVMVGGRMRAGKTRSGRQVRIQSVLRF